MEMYDVVKKLLGPIEPVGETNADEARYTNLEATIELVKRLVLDLDNVAWYANRLEFSMSRAGKRAQQFIDNCIPDKSRS